ncbi:MAG: hypothetical protein Q3971_01345 [Moraxella sp.]|nr:hypothetical protein [Moraxella sp.]
MFYHVNDGHGLIHMMVIQSCGIFVKSIAKFSPKNSVGDFKRKTITDTTLN